MSELGLLVVVLAIVGAGIAAVLTTVTISSLVQARRIRLEPSLGDAHKSIVEALLGGEAAMDDAIDILRQFSDRHVDGLVLELAPSVTGTSRSVLIELGQRIGMLQSAQIGLHSWRWSTRLYSARVLTAFGLESDEMDGLFVDRSPDVRAQAAAWAAVAPNRRAIDCLIGLLRDANGLCRFAAEDALIRIGLPAYDALVTALPTVDEDVLGRILEIGAATSGEPFSTHARRLTTHPSPGIRGRAASVLARTGTPDAGPILVRMLQDPSDDVVLAAAAGIAVLAYWPASCQVEPLLQHPLWELRRQAGLTLVALGAPGVILLRSAAGRADPSCEIATQALQLRSISIGEAIA
jgi:HEAT repeat protein